MKIVSQEWDICQSVLSVLDKKNSRPKTLLIKYFHPFLVQEQMGFASLHSLGENGNCASPFKNISSHLITYLTSSCITEAFVNVKVERKKLFNIPCSVC